VFAKDEFDFVRFKGTAPFTLNLDVLTEVYWQAGSTLAKNIGEVRELILREVRAGHTIIGEFGQAYWLDKRHGFSPNVTASHTYTPEFFESAGIPVQAIHTFGVAKAYDTKVGTHTFLTEMDDAHPLAQKLKQIEFGTSTGRQRMVGWFDAVFEEYGSATSSYQAQIASLVMSGAFQEMPDLRVVLLESGWTWLPSLLWRMDREWKGLRREVPWMTDLPSAYARKHFRLTTSPTDAPAGGAYVDELVEQLGSTEILMFGSDYPHRYPAEEEFLARIKSAGAADEVMWANAERCFPRISRSS